MPMFEFIFLGNLVVEKGVDVLLSACRELQGSSCRFTCHIVGASSEHYSVESCRSAVEAIGLQAHVCVHGPLYGRDKEDMLQRVQAMVFPTFYHNECFPFVILEAMKYGLPVISTEEGAIPDMVIHGENGLLVEKRNSKALAAAMQQLAENPELAAQMGRKGRSLYEAAFTQSAFEQRVCDILNRA